MRRERRKDAFYAPSVRRGKALCSYKVFGHDTVLRRYKEIRRDKVLRSAMRIMRSI